MAESIELNKKENKRGKSENARGSQKERGRSGEVEEGQDMKENLSENDQEKETKMEKRRTTEGEKEKMNTQTSKTTIIANAYTKRPNIPVGMLNVHQTRHFPFIRHCRIGNRMGRTNARKVTINCGRCWKYYTHWQCLSSSIWKFPTRSTLG